MKQGITPQYWKQENSGRYFTKKLKYLVHFLF